MKILITGAGGFIGGFIVEEALSRGYETWAGVRKTTSREHLSDPAIRFIDFNYGNKKILTDQLLSHKGEYGALYRGNTGTDAPLTGMRREDYLWNAAGRLL